MYRYVMCTSVLVMERRESPELRTFLMSLRRLCLCPGGPSGRLLGAGAKCAVCSWISYSFCSFSHPFFLSSFEQMNLTELKFGCSSLQLIEAAVTRLSCRICLRLRRHGNGFK